MIPTLWVSMGMSQRILPGDDPVGDKSGAERTRKFSNKRGLQIPTKYACRRRYRRYAFLITTMKKIKCLQCQTVPISNCAECEYLEKEILKEIENTAWAIREIIKQSMCEIPKRPEYMALTEESVNEHLRYAGRVNYNKALSDLLTLLQ